MRRLACIIACACALLLGLCAPVRAQAGRYCGDTAIPLTENSVFTISGPSTVWYTAWTNNLPLTVKFIPDNPAPEYKPEVEMDFKCPDQFLYNDSILNSLFLPNSSGGGVVVTMPARPALSSKTEGGVFFYYLAMGESYRDMLYKAGIDYNVQVFVKVKFKTGGTISLEPDETLANCMDGYKFMHLGDVVQVKPLDKDTHVVVPYVQWQEDSIRYVWNGTEEVHVIVNNTCEIDPETEASEAVDYFILQPQDTMKLTSSLLKNYIRMYESAAGIFYAKFYTTGTGTMKIESVPMNPPDGNATLLRYDQVTSIDTSKLYAISFTWDTATIFTTPTDHVFKMYIGTTADFRPDNAIATYQFHANDAGHWFGLTTEQMKALWTQATSQYLYVRFQCTANTTLKPTIWDMSDCFKSDKVYEIHRPSTTISVEKGSYGAKYYRFYYREWAGGTMKFQWNTSSNSACPTYIGKNCSFPPIDDHDDVLRSKEIRRNASWTISATGTTYSIDTWADKVDENGYLYIRFNPDDAGTMKITTTAPEEEDPAPIVYPAATISVVCDGEPTAEGQNFLIRVTSEQAINVYPGEASNIASRTPVATWTQTPNETHSLTLSSGVYTLMGVQQSVQIEVQ